MSNKQEFERPRCVVDDFAYIAERVRQLKAARPGPSAKHAQKLEPEDLGIVWNGADHISIQRTPSPSDAPAADKVNIETMEKKNTPARTSDRRMRRSAAGMVNPTDPETPLERERASKSSDAALPRAEPKQPIDDGTVWIYWR